MPAASGRTSLRVIRLRGLVGLPIEAPGAQCWSVRSQCGHQWLISRMHRVMQCCEGPTPSQSWSVQFLD